MYMRLLLLKLKIQEFLRESNNKQGMEMVQVAILIALAVALGIIFDEQITAFINKTFKTLNG